LITVLCGREDWDKQSRRKAGHDGPVCSETQEWLDRTGEGGRARDKAGAGAAYASGDRRERVHLLDDGLVTTLRELGGLREIGGMEAAVPEDEASGELVSPWIGGDHRAAVAGRDTESTGTVRA
jgi:hypothetical protein